MSTGRTPSEEAHENDYKMEAKQDASSPDVSPAKGGSNDVSRDEEADSPDFRGRRGQHDSMDQEELSDQESPRRKLAATGELGDTVKDDGTGSKLNNEKGGGLEKKGTTLVIQSGGSNYGNRV